MFSGTTYVLLIIGSAVALTNAFSPKCKHEGEHKIPDPNSCRGYYQCKDGVASHATCSWFKLFDNVVMDCQKMWIVDCQAVPPQFPPASWHSTKQ